LYYNFSFCDDISKYKNEIHILDELLDNNPLIIPNATSMPFSFALSRSRKVNPYFQNKKYLFMLVGLLEEKKRFINNILAFIPFDNQFLNFCLNNKNKMNEWQQGLLFYIINYYSTSLCSFDGPFPEEPDFHTIKSHLMSLLTVGRRRFNINFGDDSANDGTRLYEFPNNISDFRKGSLIITNKTLQNYELLFEDKLKIYGV
jgi:hypothetical protein